MRLYIIEMKDTNNKLLDSFKLTTGDYELPTIASMLSQGLDVIEKHENIEFVLTYSDPMLGYVTSKPMHI